VKEIDLRERFVEMSHLARVQRELNHRGSSIGPFAREPAGERIQLARRTDAVLEAKIEVGGRLDVNLERQHQRQEQGQEGRAAQEGPEGPEGPDGLEQLKGR